MKPNVSNYIPFNHDVMYKYDRIFKKIEAKEPVKLDSYWYNGKYDKDSTNENDMQSLSAKGIYTKSADYQSESHVITSNEGTMATDFETLRNAYSMCITNVYTVDANGNEDNYTVPDGPLKITVFQSELYIAGTNNKIKLANKTGNNNKYFTFPTAVSILPTQFELVKVTDPKVFRSGDKMIKIYNPKTKAYLEWKELTTNANDVATIEVSNTGTYADANHTLGVEIHEFKLNRFVSSDDKYKFYDNRSGTADKANQYIEDIFEQFVLYTPGSNITLSKPSSIYRVKAFDQYYVKYFEQGDTATTVNLSNKLFPVAECNRYVKAFSFDAVDVNDTDKPITTNDAKGECWVQKDTTGVLKQTPAADEACWRKVEFAPGKWHYMQVDKTKPLVCGVDIKVPTDASNLWLCLNNPNDYKLVHALRHVNLHVATDESVNFVICTKIFGVNRYQFPDGTIFSITDNTRLQASLTYGDYVVLHYGPLTNMKVSADTIDKIKGKNKDTNKVNDKLDDEHFVYFDEPSDNYVITTITTPVPEAMYEPPVHDETAPIKDIPEPPEEWTIDSEGSYVVEYAVSPCSPSTTMYMLAKISGKIKTELVTKDTAAQTFTIIGSPENLTLTRNDGITVQVSGNVTGNVHAGAAVTQGLVKLTGHYREITGPNTDANGKKTGSIKISKVDATDNTKKVNEPLATMLINTGSLMITETYNNATAAHKCHNYLFDNHKLTITVSGIDNGVTYTGTGTIDFEQNMIDETRASKQIKCTLTNVTSAGATVTDASMEFSAASWKYDQGAFTVTTPVCKLITKTTTTTSSKALTFNTCTVTNHVIVGSGDHIDPVGHLNLKNCEFRTIANSLVSLDFVAGAHKFVANNAARLYVTYGAKYSDNLLANLGCAILCDINISNDKQVEADGTSITTTGTYVHKYVTNSIIQPFKFDVSTANCTVMTLNPLVGINTATGALTGYVWCRPYYNNNKSALILNGTGDVTVAKDGVTNKLTGQLTASGQCNIYGTNAIFQTCAVTANESCNHKVISTDVGGYITGDAYGNETIMQLDGVTIGDANVGATFDKNRLKGTLSYTSAAGQEVKDVFFTKLEGLDCEYDLVTGLATLTLQSTLTLKTDKTNTTHDIEITGVQTSNELKFVCNATLVDGTLMITSIKEGKKFPAVVATSIKYKAANSTTDTTVRIQSFTLQIDKDAANENLYSQTDIAYDYSLSSIVSSSVIPSSVRALKVKLSNPTLVIDATGSKISSSSVEMKSSTNNTLDGAKFKTFIGSISNEASQRVDVTGFNHTFDYGGCSFIGYITNTSDLDHDCVDVVVYNQPVTCGFDDKVVSYTVSGICTVNVDACVSQLETKTIVGVFRDAASNKIDGRVISNDNGTITLIGHVTADDGLDGGAGA